MFQPIEGCCSTVADGISGRPVNGKRLPQGLQRIQPTVHRTG